WNHDPAIRLERLTQFAVGHRCGTERIRRLWWRYLDRELWRRLDRRLRPEHRRARRHLARHGQHADHHPRPLGAGLRTELGLHDTVLLVGPGRREARPRRHVDAALTRAE